MAYIQKRITRGGQVRYNVRWRVGDGQRQRSFVRARDAEAFRRELESEELRGARPDPRRGELRLRDYANDWFEQRRRADGRHLAPRTKELYRSLLDRFILPGLGGRQLTALRTEDIRRWHTDLADRFGPMQAAKSYRLLRVILNTALEDERLAVNPCKIRGAGVERSPERPFIDAEIVLRLASAIEERYCALVLLAGFGGLRLGELLGLRRSDIDPTRSLVRVERQTVEMRDGERITTAPKTDAGRRVVNLPSPVTAALVGHLDRFALPGPDAPVFTGPASEGLRRATLYKAWHEACTAVGQTDIHLHDLRHAAGTLAAQQGASLRELMARLGHASPAAAHRYQHAAERRDAIIAVALEAVMREVWALEGSAIPLWAETVASIEATATEVGDQRGISPSEEPIPPTGKDSDNPSERDVSGASDGNRTRVLSLGS